MLGRLIREALFHRDSERRHLAALLIASSPFGETVTDELLRVVVDDGYPGWMRVRARARHKDGAYCWLQGRSVVFDQRRDTVTATARPGFALRERVAVQERLEVIVVECLVDPRGEARTDFRLVAVTDRLHQQILETHLLKDLAQNVEDAALKRLALDFHLLGWRLQSSGKAFEGMLPAKLGHC